ncbi:HEAT repeat-containing protein 6-like isoform X1 [Mytilus trossulus]|uniref:HEAT repeat-containing protein 6-like isoform X1 n=1 Tax=Mytilus trossulus TaxID=6551 RepID=UPI0030058EE1
MADESGFSAVERDRFEQCFKRFMKFTSQGDEMSRTNLNLLLDEINSIDYSSKIVTEEEANALIQFKLCRLIPLHDERLLVKVCQTVFNFTARQQLNLTESTLLAVTEYLIGGAQRCQPWALPMILQALGAVVYENVGLLTKFHDILLSRRGILIPLIEGGATEEEVLRQAVQTLENMTIKVSGQTYMEDRYASLCFDIFMKLLHKIPTTRLESMIQCKVMICTLRGLQNLLAATKIMPSEQLGPLLAGVRTSMFHGISNIPVMVPDTLHPTPLSNVEPSSSDKTPTSPQKSQAEGQGNKKSKKRKPKKGKEQDEGQPDQGKGQDDTNLAQAVNGLSVEGQVRGEQAVFRPAWAKISSSESDFSDTEGGQSSRYRSTCAKVRQCALACLHTVIKNTDKKVMFGYWSSFIPDSVTSGNSSQIQTLFTIILKDPSPKCRMGALATLTALLDGTKTFLAAADDSDQSRTAFTAFSTVLGSTVHELHRCLLLALVSENFPLTLTQLIKCLSTLISNVPYQKMRPGLLSRVVKQVRNFLGHRDPNVRVACLTCFGAVSAIQPPLMEVCHIIQPSRTTSLSLSSSTKDLPNPVIAIKTNDPVDSGFNSNQSPESGNLEAGNVSPGLSTPSPGISGTQTPVYSDPLLQSQASQTSWLIKLCVKNITPQPRGFGENGEYYTEPLPVRLESLQVLAHLTKGYFPIIRNSLPILRDLTCKCFEDSDGVIRLHTSKLLDELTQALQKDIQALDQSDGAQRLSSTEVHQFWDYILNGPIPKILQREAHNPVKAVTCDCLSNIGADVFNIISMDKRILCITLILGLTSDEDRVVRSSAVRTLGVYVLYTCLREDVNFVADAANAILTCMADSSLNVRLKTAWSLANLCDALVLNKDDGDTEFMEDFSDLLLQKLFTTATHACQDNDKVKSNAVRALGNIMRYLPTRSLAKIPFRTAVEDGVKALVKNISSGAMKVRWNACYAVSNLFRNSLLNHGNSPWIKDILITLCSVVTDCKNFKVRINAALALGSPAERCHYGNQDLYLHVWESLIKGLKTAEDITDFAEYRYRDSLNDHICSAILHIILLTTQEDLTTLSDLLTKEDITVYFDRFKNSTKHKELPQAEEQLRKLESDGSLTKSEKCVVNNLIDLCRIEGNIHAREYIRRLDKLERSIDEDEEKEPEKTAFVQTYD